jgi:drug/metabolite transporter (DMT)-like permease
VSPRHAAYLGALAVIWGASYLLIKYCLESFSPAEIVVLRCALGAAVLRIIIQAQGPQARAGLHEAGRRWKTALLLGAVQVTVPFLLIGFGEEVVPSGLTAVLIAPSPIFVAIFALSLDRSETLAARQGIGLLVGLAGVALLVGLETVHSLEQFLGALGIIAASACYGLSTFVVKGPYGRTPAIVTSYLSLVAGALLALPVAVITVHTSTPTLRAVLSMVGLGVAGTAIAFVIYYWLINQIGAGRASLVSYLTPAIALAYGATLHNEAITIAAIGGLVLILAGVGLASRASPPTPGEAPA